MAQALSVLIALMLLGCATPQERQAQQDWRIICANAPHTAGQEIDRAEQRAMTRVGAWTLSVDEVDARCP